jgi:hypothetical protein
MMVYFRKWLPELVVNDYNELIVGHGLSGFRSSTIDDNADDSSPGGVTARVADQQIGS